MKWSVIVVDENDVNLMKNYDNIEAIQQRLSRWLINAKVILIVKQD